MKTLLISIAFVLLSVTTAFCLPTGVATFASIGLEWDTTGKGKANEAVVEYRVDGTEPWSTAQSLFYDDRSATPNEQIYKGSIVNLEPGTTYNVRVTLQSDPFTTESIDVTTWSNTFPEGSVTNVTNTADDLVISTSGTAEAYLVWQGSGGSATIDVNNGERSCITVATGVHHVIIRDLILVDCSNFGVELQKETADIIIDNVEITGWGQTGQDYQGAVYFYDAGEIGPTRIVVQRSYFHDPRFSSNAWEEGHPGGPQGITIFDSPGNNVFRYNTIIGDTSGNDLLYFNDAMGAGTNCDLSKTGFPGPNSDIYRNYIQNSWDDAIEIEGSGKNVRVWGNYENKIFNAMASGCNWQGPLYVWRNIMDTSRYVSDLEDPDDYGRGEFMKAGNRDTPTESGVTYMYHNTMLMKDVGETYPLGGLAFFTPSAGGVIYYMITRNNIAQNNDDAGSTIKWLTTSCTNSSDYDFWNGAIHTTKCSTPAPEVNGIEGEPTYETNHGNQAGDTGWYWLDAGASGHDDGVVLPNFNDGYEGVAPDIGAHERDSDQMIFGVAAYAAYESEEETIIKKIMNYFRRLRGDNGITQDNQAAYQNALAKVQEHLAQRP